MQMQISKMRLVRGLMEEALAKGAIIYECPDGMRPRNLRVLAYRIREAARAEGNTRYDPLKFTTSGKSLGIRNIYA